MKTLIKKNRNELLEYIKCAEDNRYQRKILKENLQLLVNENIKMKFIISNLQAIVSLVDNDDVKKKFYHIFNKFNS